MEFLDEGSMPEVLRRHHGRAGILLCLRDSLLGGLRIGELLALEEGDIDFESKMLKVSKSYQRIKGQDIIAGLSPERRSGRLLPKTKDWANHKAVRDCKIADLEKIRVHDLRRNHASLLIDMRSTALAISDRMGHESVDITYRYARPFPNLQTKIAKALNAQGELLISRPNSHRERSIAIRFRATPEEARRIDVLVASSGITKQDFIVSKLTDCPITPSVSPRIVSLLRHQLNLVYSELRRIWQDECLDADFRSSVELITRTIEPPRDIEGFKNEMSVDEAGFLISSMSRI